MTKKQYRQPSLSFGNLCQILIDYCRENNQILVSEKNFLFSKSVLESFQSYNTGIKIFEIWLECWMFDRIMDHLLNIQGEGLTIQSQV